MVLNSVKKLLIGGALSLAVVLPTMSHAQTAAKIGFISTSRILNDSKYATELTKKLEKEFSSRQKSLEETDARIRAEATKLDKDSITLTEPEKVSRRRKLQDLDFEFQKNRRQFEEDLQQRKQVLINELTSKANSIIREIATAGNYDLIIAESNGIVHVNKKLDLTDEVLKKLDAGK